MLTDEQKDRLDRLKDRAKKIGESPYSLGIFAKHELHFLLSIIDSLASRVKELEEKFQRVAEANQQDALTIVEGFEKEQALQSRLDRVEEAANKLLSEVDFSEDKGAYPISEITLKKLSEAIRRKV